ncbi:Ku protein [Streptomyces deserti]
MLPLSEDDLASLPLPTKHTITVVGFIEPHGVVPISYDRPYYIAPASRDADRPYALLVEVSPRPGSWPGQGRDPQPRTPGGGQPVSGTAAVADPALA